MELEMMKFSNNLYYPVDLITKIIYNAPTKIKSTIEGVKKSRSAVPLFLAKRGNELNSKAFYAIDFTVKDATDYQKDRKIKKAAKKKPKKVVAKQEAPETFDIPTVKRRKKK